MNDDAIGYGKPPKSSMWKPGQSGNPKGRPKARIDHLADGYLILTNPVKTNSSKASEAELEPVEAGLLNKCSMALKGNKTALFQLLELILKHLEVSYPHTRSTDSARVRMARLIGLKVVDGVILAEDADEEDEDEPY